MGFRSNFVSRHRAYEMYKQIQFIGKIDLLVNILCKLYHVYKESCLEIQIFLNCPLYLTYLLYFQLFSTVDLLSYIGGVLGLCLGFSAMSALECIYFFTLRLGLNIRMKRSEHDVWLLNSWKLFQFVWNNKGFIIYIIAIEYLLNWSLMWPSFSSCISHSQPE